MRKSRTIERILPTTLQLGIHGLKHPSKEWYGAWTSPWTPIDRLENTGGTRLTWEPEVEEIKRREELAKQMGGPANVERQHSSGKLTVRERIDRLLDTGSFHEIGALAGQADL